MVEEKVRAFKKGIVSPHTSTYSLKEICEQSFLESKALSVSVITPRFF